MRSRPLGAQVLSHVSLAYYWPLCNGHCAIVLLPGSLGFTGCLFDLSPLADECSVTGFMVLHVLRIIGNSNFMSAFSLSRTQLHSDG